MPRLLVEGGRDAIAVTVAGLLLAVEPAIAEGRAETTAITFGVGVVPNTLVETGNVATAARDAGETTLDA